MRYKKILLVSYYFLSGLSNKFCGKNMNNKNCKCGHLKSDHADFIDRFDPQKNRMLREFVAKGLGKCEKCDCDYFKK